MIACSKHASKVIRGHIASCPASVTPLRHCTETKMCLIVEIRFFCNHTEYDTVFVCDVARGGNLGNGPSVAVSCPHQDFMRVESEACCQGCLLDLLEDFRDDACGECREMIRVRSLEWEMENLRRDVEIGRLMESTWRVD